MRYRGKMRSIVSLWTCLLFVACPLFLAPSLSFGQIVNASLTGTVTDPTGAAVPDASVTLTDVATGLSTKTMTDPTGSYNLPSLHPAQYTLIVEKAGFKTFVQTGVTLLVDQKATVNVQLQVGNLATRVEVSGAAPIVDTSTASVGTVVGATETVDLPLNLRRFGALAALAPGTVPDNGGFASSNLTSPFSETTYSANGGRTSANNYLIDGVDSRSLVFAGFALQPPPDAVEEFRLQTNIYDAAFGKNSGSTINLVTKSGTNEFHGNLYEFLRNNDLDSGNFFSRNTISPATGLEIPGTRRYEYRRNQYGFTIGGPIKKNKVFFFGNYEGLRQVQGNTLLAIVPTPAELQGNFSNYLTGQTINLCGSGGPSNLNFDSGQLFDPATLTTITCPAGSSKAGSTILTGTPIPGNTLTSIDPVAAHVLSLNAFPASNRPGVPNFVNTQPSVRNDSQVLGRVDYKINDKNDFFAHYMFGESNELTPGSGYSDLPTFGDSLYFRGQNVALGWTHTFGGHLLNEARFGFQRNYDIENCASCPRSPTFMQQFGITHLQPPASYESGFPIFSFNNFTTVGDSEYRPVISPDMVEKYNDNLTWTHGRHTIVVGVDMDYFQIFRAAASFSPHGQLAFNGQYSGLASEIPGVLQISDLADFLQGYPDTANRTVSFADTNNAGGGYFNYYGQDNIRLSSKLAVNLGLRWEYRKQPYDKSDNRASLIPIGPAFSGPGNALLVTPFPAAVNDALCTNKPYLISASGECLVASSQERAKLGFTGAAARTLIYPYWRDWAPRIGITWRPTNSDKLIFHTGYGIFYDIPNYNSQDASFNNPIGSPSQIYNTTFGLAPPLTNGVPTNSASVFGAGGIPLLSQEFNQMFLDPNWKAPMVQSWSFGAESQLSGNWALEVDYIGNRGHHLDDIHLFANQPLPGVGPLQPRRPYPDYNIIATYSSDANSWYDSLQTKLTKRFSNGLTFLVAYTWQHGLDDNEGDEGFGGGSGNTSAQNTNDRAADKGNGYTDAPQRFVVSYIYQLPVGSGKRYLNSHGVADKVLGGWEVSGITSYQSGYPISVHSPTDYSNTGSINPRPDRVAGCSGEPRTLTEWFNTSCFTLSALQAALAAGEPRFGNAGRNTLYGPGYGDWDLALLKNFSLSERFKLQFRYEMYNMLNHPSFTSVNSTLTSSLYGQVTGASAPRDIQFGLKLSF